jgi:hypothetical protein
VVWSTGYNIEMALAAMHKLTEAYGDGDLAQVTEFASVLNHYLKHDYLRLQERRDFFTDAAENGRSEAILLQKYLRLNDQPFTFPLYCEAKKSFSELRAKAFAKDLSKKQPSSAHSSNKPGQNCPPRNAGHKRNKTNESGAKAEPSK